MRAVFVDANAALRALAESIGAAALPGLDALLRRRRHRLPTRCRRRSPARRSRSSTTPRCPIEVARRCEGLRHVVFLGTGARSYMDPEALASIGIEVHLIKGYGDTAVAECAIGLLFAAARGFAAMDRAMRDGRWLRSEGVQLTGKTLGLIGFGGIAAEVARLAHRPRHEGAGVEPDAPARRRRRRVRRPRRAARRRATRSRCTCS